MRQVLLQIASAFLSKCDSYYKIRQFYHKMRQLLQDASLQYTPFKFDLIDWNVALWNRN